MILAMFGDAEILRISPSRIEGRTPANVAIAKYGTKNPAGRLPFSPV